MSRSGYVDDCDNLAMWRGVIASASRGKRGQRFFRELVAALDAMPVKRLAADVLETDEDTKEGDCCALGALARAKGADLEPDDTYDYAKLGETFNIAEQLAQETMWINDEAGPYRGETPEQRWERVRKWAASQIRADREAPETGTPGSQP